MLVRILTGLIGLALFFAILFTNATIFNFAVYIVIAGMLCEIYKATKPGKILVASGIISAILLTFGKVFNVFIPMLAVVFMIYAVICVFQHTEKKYTDVISSAFLTLYIVLFMSTTCNVRTHFGIYGIIMVFLCAWMTDTAAYFSGRFFGKHKLIEKVSPKKTVEGAIGGILVTSISCVIYAFILTKLNVIKFSISKYVLFAVLGFFGSILSQIGDLFASAIKRDCGIKDFGTIFPGHGGILDRFDSVVFIIPFIYYFMNYFDLMRL